MVSYMDEKLQVTPGPYPGLWETWFLSDPLFRVLYKSVPDGYLIRGFVDEKTVFVNLDEEL